MALRHLTKPPAPVAAAPAPAPAPEPVAAVTVVPEAPRGIALFEAHPAGATLDALLAVAAANSATLRFPVIKIQSGSSVKAAFVAPDFNEEEVRMQLPEGTKPVEAVFLAHRIAVSAWPAGYDETATEPAKPAFSCHVSGGNTADTVKATEAAKKYQFTKREAKAKFDVSAGGPGHIRTSLELLLWYPGIGGLIELRCPAGHSPTELSAKALRALCDPKTGALVCQPVSLVPVTTEAKTWLTQSVGLTTLTGPTGKALWEQFLEWKTLALADAETVEAVNAWVGCTDSPITDSIRAALELGARL